MTEFNTSAGIEDLLGEEEEQFVQESVSIKTGVGTNIIADKPDDEGLKPDARRWLFNPFEVIDLTNEPTSCGVPYLKNVVFNPIKSLDINVSRQDAYGLPGEKHNADNYVKAKRTSLMIATELCDKNGDKGVVMITGLLDEDETTAADLNSLLFGDEVPCVVDIDNPNHPCPVLPRLLETLHANTKASLVSIEDQTTRNDVTKAATECRKSIVTAMKNARTRINLAQERILDKTNPNRNFSIAEKRCYLALGLEIPDVMPYTTATAAAGAANGGQIDSEAIGRGFAQGMAKIGMKIVPDDGSVGGHETNLEEPQTPTDGFPPVPSLEELGAGTDAGGKASFEVDETDVENADKTADEAQTGREGKCSELNGKGNPCGNDAKANGRCGSHGGE